jgi:hypothetical protein
MAGVNSTTPSIQRPFGGLPNEVAGRMATAQLDPLITGFGLGPNTPAYRRFQARLGGSTGPLADLIKYVQGFEPGVTAQAEKIGADAAARGSATFTSLQGQIDDLLGKLPGFEAVAAEGTRGAEAALGHAGDFARAAFDPTRDQPLYQESARRLLQTIRPGEAARGLEGSGAAQQAETDASRNLALDFARTQTGDQSTAIQNLLSASSGVQGAAGNQAQLAAGGIAPLEALMQAIPGLENLQAQKFQFPMQTVQQLLGLLTSGQAGGQGLLSATAPVVASESKGTKIL